MLYKNLYISLNNGAKKCQIDIMANTIDFDITEEELAKRRANWVPRQPKITTGYLARYASLVASGNRGAVLEIQKNKKEDMVMREAAKLISKYFGIIIIVFMILGVVTPGAFKRVISKVFGQSVINILLGIIMFGMGMTLSLNDFKIVLKRPLDVLKGTAAQFIIMPVLAFLLSKAFGLEEALMIGVVLVGTCPGGTSSNVISYMAGGDVALSVAMTTVSTLLVPF